MICWRCFLVSLTVLLLQASCYSPSSASHVLPLGDINVIVVTDDHSWVAGHGAHESRDADYGDLLSFYERLVSSTEAVFLVHNGDFMDGTGLSTYPPIHLEPILLKMPWDAVNVGNHDIYNNESVMFMTRPGGLVDTLGERYLTSNVVNASTGKPIGCRYRYLRGSSNVTVLTFGFIYNLHGVGSSLTRVEQVQDAVHQRWFTQILRTGNYDAVLVLAHMGSDDPSVKVILSAIRNETTPEMPIQFITGHTHHRRFHVLDDWSTAIEAGCCLNTIGFVSFPSKQSSSSSSTSFESAAGTSSSMTSSIFRHDFIDATVEAFESRLDVSVLKTERGRALSDFIRKIQNDMGLTRIVGCAPRTYYVNRSLDEHDSLFGLWSRDVATSQFIANDTRRVILQGTASSFRYDLFQGNVTVDDLVVVSPFNDSMYLVASDVPTDTIVDLKETMNVKHDMDGLSPLPAFILIGDLTAHESHDLYTLEYEVPFIRQALQDLGGRDVQPRPVDSFATSLWLSFLESCWKSCGTFNAGCSDYREASTEEKIQYFELNDRIFRVDKRMVVATTASPGIAAVLVAIVSAFSAIILLGWFTMRRLPRGR